MDCVATSLNHESAILLLVCQKNYERLDDVPKYVPSHGGFEALQVAHVPTVAVFELALCCCMDYTSNNMN